MIFFLIVKEMRYNAWVYSKKDQGSYDFLLFMEIYFLPTERLEVCGKDATRWLYAVVIDFSLAQSPSKSFNLLFSNFFSFRNKITSRHCVHKWRSSQFHKWWEFAHSHIRKENSNNLNIFISLHFLQVSRKQRGAVF